MVSMRVSSIKRGMGLLIPLSLFILFFTGCGASLQEIRAKESLERARTAYARAKADPNVETHAPKLLADAGRIIQAARETTNYKEMEQLGYLAEKKSQTALSVAEGKVVEKEIETLNKEAADVLMQKRLLEAKLAKVEAEAKAQEAEQARLAAAKLAATAERAKKEAEESRALAFAEAEKAERSKSEAEAKARETEKARVETEAKAREVARAKKETEARAQEIEKARKEAEAKAREAEKARLESKAEAEKAERARMEAEARVREAEQTKAEIDQFLRELSELQGKMTERGIMLTMGDVLFAFGKADLASGAVRNVDKLAEFLEKHPKRNVVIEGHTDSVGSEEFNLALSQRRADAVKEVLMAKGVSSERILTKGYGKEFPVASNDTESGRQLNRRVEVLILNEGVDPETVVR
jgi:outer membrane protein OmpA-like peptidoglycan-associated protein